MRRRRFLRLMGSGACLSLAPRLTLIHLDEPAKPDVTLRIAPVDLEIAPGKIIKTIGYNGAVPGPFLRFREGKQVTVEVFNDTGDPELVHWHGMFLAPDVDGSVEEGTPLIPPHHSARYTFEARPAGTRWYHTHVSAGRNLKRSTFTGQFGMVYIGPAHEPGAYDAKYSLCLHGWQPYLGSMGGEGTLDAIYQSYSINDRALGHGEPIRVRQGQRVLFRILNASATMPHQLALAGHQFTVIALDGNPVASPRAVDVLALGPAERVDAIVTMNAPGVWILGELDEQTRKQGMGVVVEYENRSGEPQWVAPQNTTWDYTLFGTTGESKSAEPAEIVPLVFRRKFAGNNWVDHWTINGKEFPKTDPIRVRKNQKYRLRFDNQSDEDHPVHLHRHTFELTQVAGKKTAGVFKDVVVVPRRNVVEADLLTDHPGLTLFHCHQQLHMDYGFMALMRYED
jgi:FtsP/CotA-like multicopper oxidase with cupredoxin domain